MARLRLLALSVLALLAIGVVVYLRVLNRPATERPLVEAGASGLLRQQIAELRFPLPQGQVERALLLPPPENAARYLHCLGGSCTVGYSYRTSDSCWLMYTAEFEEGQKEEATVRDASLRCGD